MTQQGTPWGRIKESVDLPNGVTLGLIGGGGVVAIAPNNATQDKSMRLIDNHEAASWLLYSVKGEFPKAPTLDPQRYTSDKDGNLRPYRAPRPKGVGTVITMPDGSRMKLVPAE